MDTAMETFTREASEREENGCTSMDGQQYEYVRRIGRGAFSEVWEAMDSSLNRFAIKKQDVFESADDPLPLRIQRELFVLQNVSHPNIIQLHSYFRDFEEELFIMVLDYFPQTLDNFTRTNKDPSNIPHILRQILSAASHLHSMGIAHRDLKPHNILVNESHHVALIDFGSSRQMEAEVDAMELDSTAGSAWSTTVTNFGTETDRQDHYSSHSIDQDDANVLTLQVATRPYRAPELLLGHKTYTCAVDMWAIGCIMYEMYERKLLFCEQADYQNLLKIFDVLGGPRELDGIGHFDFFAFDVRPGLEPHEFVPSMSNEAYDLFRKLLTQNPKRRVTAEESLDHPFVSAAT